MIKNTPQVSFQGPLTGTRFTGKQCQGRCNPECCKPASDKLELSGKSESKAPSSFQSLKNLINKL